MANYWRLGPGTWILKDGGKEGGEEEMGLWRENKGLGQVGHAVGREERGRIKKSCTELSETPLSGEMKKKKGKI